MRHTRNRQMFKLTKHKFWKETYNLPIWEVRKWTKELDQTFKWHRESYPMWGHYVEFEKEVSAPLGRIEKRVVRKRVK